MYPYVVSISTSNPAPCPPKRLSSAHTHTHTSLPFPANPDRQTDRQPHACMHAYPRAPQQTHRHPITTRHTQLKPPPSPPRHSPHPHSPPPYFPSILKQHGSPPLSPPPPTVHLANNRHAQNTPAPGHPPPKTSVRVSRARSCRPACAGGYGGGGGGGGQGWRGACVTARHSTTRAQNQPFWESLARGLRIRAWWGLCMLGVGGYIPVSKRQELAIRSIDELVLALIQMPMRRR